MTYLFTVADRYKIEGRGCIFTPGCTCEKGDPEVKIGHRVRLKFPGGNERDTVVQSIEHIRHPRVPEKITFPIMFPPNISIEDVPVGTQVYLLEEDFSTVR